MDQIDTPGIVSANVENTTGKDDPLVKTWMNRIKAAETHWAKFHKRVRHNRKLVRGIDDQAQPETSKYNAQRANLIQSTISVVLSKVYAKNPEMSGEPTNKSQDLRLFCDTLTTVTQTMLDDANLKKSAKRAVRAAQTCSFGIVKLQYQRDIRTDPIISKRIQDSQDNILNIESLLAQVEDGDEGSRCDLESKRRELQQAIQGLEAQKEVVAGEGLVLDVVKTDRMLFDPAIEDIWDYEDSDWMVEKIPMRKSKAMGLFTVEEEKTEEDENGQEVKTLKREPMDLSNATAYKVAAMTDTANAARPYSANIQVADNSDPLILVYEAWNKVDNTIYTLINGITTQFARKPYQPQYSGERWWPYFLLPFASVDGEFVSQSLVDCLEKLQEEHNETRDKFAEVRRTIRPHLIVSAEVSDKQITNRTHPELGEIIVVDTQGQSLQQFVMEGTQIQIDPRLYDTSAIQNDWEMVSGLQEAARSVVTTPKTATEANISDQSLAARVSEFRDQVEDWLTEIAKCASELCLLAMTPQQVEQIMGGPEDPMAENMENMAEGEAPHPPEKTYEWPENRSPETVFNLVQIKVRAGSTSAPNKLKTQENWSRAMPLIQQGIVQIRAIDAAGGDSTPERELLKETAARFDETIDVERFLPAKPKPQPMGLPQIPGMPPGLPMPGGVPGAPPTPAM
jgi:hypothetical protein